MAKQAKIEYRHYPEFDDVRSGCKVSWYYYKNEADAKKASVVAKHNAQIAWNQGYDFGYCSPGSISGPHQQNFRPGMWEVCIP